MNLHLIDDEKFFDPFVEKLESLNLLENNIFIVKECGPLKFIKRSDLVHGRMCEKDLIGDTRQYKKVFIHCFTPDMYDWVLEHSFKELNWMIWGKELYSSDLVNYPLYELLTKEIVKKVSTQRFSFNLGYWRPKNVIRRVNLPRIFSKFDNILTWIEPEYEYAVRNIKGLRAKHQQFAYMFEMDANVLRRRFGNAQSSRKRITELRCILGNSGVASNNHLDAIQKTNNIPFKEILIPISYGNERYIELLKDAVQTIGANGNISYLDKYVSFTDYIEVFDQYDVFISNSIRPVGMGNVWMALLMGKLVFMNRRNLVFPYLRAMGIEIFDIGMIEKVDSIFKTIDLKKNADLAAEFLSNKRINKMYVQLFSKEVAMQHEAV
ncbi:TDP-N-acetylfucosamine:lipid II N-acetylfucosaminyltransferase [Olivibacter sp. XZL3]|uniref:TDP-N-acetylfucosamine:lipid II N-acetylfucosaminyltransferase n=1 Tax=Olivibacter sp. XZL3 TaxID=1735116 RepID=UPI0010647984|nr:TDP-N-acetylfucosamine:lipid II N-acetylfucosaminyltransferase [Olivibacter sp. XZL3]